MTTYNLSLMIFYRQKLLNSPTKHSQIFGGFSFLFLLPASMGNIVTVWKGTSNAPKVAEVIWISRVWPTTLGMWDARLKRLPKKNAYSAGHISGIVFEGIIYIYIYIIYIIYIYTWIVIFRWYKIIYAWIAIFGYLLCHFGRKMNISPPWSRM